MGLTLVFAAGCSSGPTQESAPSGGPGFPVSIPNRYGETVVPAEPKRVVSIGYTDQDTILAFGVVPVAIREFIGHQPSATWPWARPMLGDAKPEVLPASDVSVEKLAGLRPDLIVAMTAGLSREQYETFSKIAPTLVPPAQFIDHGVPWQETTRLIGAALGKPARAEQMVTDLERRFAEARAAHPEFAGKLVAGARPNSVDPSQYMVWGSQDVRARFFSALGFGTPAEFDRRAGMRFYAQLSTELLGRLDDSDLVVWITGGEAERARIPQLAGYERLRVVRENRTLVLDDELSAALSFSSVLSLPAALDTLPARMAERLPR